MFNRNVEPEMFGQGMAPKKIFWPMQPSLSFLTVRLAPGNVVMVVVDICGNSPITGM